MKKYLPFCLKCCLACLSATLSDMLVEISICHSLWHFSWNCFLPSYLACLLKVLSATLSDMLFEIPICHSIWHVFDFVEISICHSIWHVFQNFYLPFCLTCYLKCLSATLSGMLYLPLYLTCCLKIVSAILFGMLFHCDFDMLLQLTCWVKYLSAILPHVYLTFLPATLPDILTWNFYLQSTQHTTPIAKFHISVDANLVLSGAPFYSKTILLLQYHQNMTGTPPKHHRNTPKHHRNTTKTWARLKTSPNTVKTYRHAAKVTPRRQRPPKHNWETTKTPAGGQTPSTIRTNTIRTDTANSRKGPRRVFVFQKNCCRHTLSWYHFSRHHHQNTVSTDIHHHQNTIIISIIIISIIIIIIFFNFIFFFFFFFSFFFNSILTLIHLQKEIYVYRCRCKAWILLTGVSV